MQKTHTKHSFQQISRVHNPNMVRTITFKPHNNTVLAGLSNGILAIHDCAAKKQFQLNGHVGPINQLAYSKDGRLASAGHDGSIRVWKGTVDSKHQKLVKHFGPVQSIQFTCDGRLLISGSNDRSVKVFNSTDLKFIKSFDHHKHWVQAARLSPCGKMLISGGQDNRMIVSDFEKGNIISEIEHPSVITDLRLMLNQRAIAMTGCQDGVARVYDVRQEKMVQYYEAHRDRISCLSVHPQGRHFLSCSSDGTAKLWDMKRGKLDDVIYEQGGIEAGAFSSKGEMICLGGLESTSIWLSKFRKT